MEPWMRVHEVMTHQEWQAMQPRPDPDYQRTFYDRWQASNNRLRDWLQANSFHVEPRGDQ
jgi:hypothetical protein